MNTDIRSATYSDMTSKVSDYSVDTKTTDGIYYGQEESYWDFSKFTERYGYYHSIPELKSAIQAYATWVLGQGYQCDERTKIQLNLITGWGEDTFMSVLWNMLVIKKVNGDAFAEVITHNGKSIDKGGIIINLKPLSPQRVRIVLNSKGKIIRYEYTDNYKKQTFKPIEIFHISNNRVADEMHGDSIIDSVKWAIDAKNEAMSDWRRISHRATIRVMYVDEDDPIKLNIMKTKYAEAINKGELLLVPGKPGENTFQDLTLPPVEAFLAWIRYLENYFYQALGVPKVILGGVSENTEASAKVAVIVYEPTFTREITELEKDLWSQLKIKIKINKQPSLMDNMYSDEQKNTGQVGFQPNDTQAGVGK